MSIVENIYKANEVDDDASEDVKYSVLSEIYFKKHGVTFENFVVVGTPLMKKARIMIESVLNGDRKALITNKDLDISKPEDALY
jgi:hypothetical protein